MRCATALSLLLSATLACDGGGGAEPPSVVAVSPEDGSSLSHHCPIRLQFSESLDGASVQVSGTIGVNSVMILRTTEEENDAAELYPAYLWPLGEQSITVSTRRLFGAEAQSTFTYLVEEGAPEPWQRAAAHRGAFLQGDLVDVWFADAQTGYALGSTDVILKTEDGGATWAQTAPPLEVDPVLRAWTAFSGLDAERLWALTAARTVWRTEDGGATWTEVHAFVQVAGGQIWSDLLVVDENTLLVSGRGISRSIDGGQTWTEVLDTGTTLVFELVLDESGALFGLTGGTLYRSDDQGASFAALETGLEGALHALDGAEGRLWLTGSGGLIAASDDGGNSFSVQHQDSPAQPTGAISAVAARSGLEAVAGGSDGTLWSTTDGGETWTARAEPVTPGRISALAVVESDDGPRWWAAAPDAFLAFSDDAGETFTNTVEGTNRKLNAAWATDVDTVTVVGDGGLVLTSSDGGATFVRRDSGSDADLADVWGIGDELWVLGAAGDVLYSANGGASFEERAPVEVGAALFGAEDGHLWAVGGGCTLVGTTVYHSTDGGLSWETTELDDIVCLSDVWAADADHVWATGHRSGFENELVPRGVVAISDDGGATFTQSEVADGVISHIYGADRANLWVSGSGRTLATAESLVARSTDGGLTWALQRPVAAPTQTGLFAAGPADAWGAGIYGGTYPIMFSTPLGCGTPAGQPAVGPEVIRALHGTPDGTRLWVVGDAGLIATLRR